MAIHGGSTDVTFSVRPFIVGHKLVQMAAPNNCCWSEPRSHALKSLKGRVEKAGLLSIYPNIFKICGTIHLQNHVSLLALQLR